MINIICPATINYDACAYHYGDAQDAVSPATIHAPGQGLR